MYKRRTVRATPTATATRRNNNKQTTTYFEIFTDDEEIKNQNDTENKNGKNISRNTLLNMRKNTI